MTLFLIGAVLYYYEKIPKKNTVLILSSLLIGGAIGNLLDRIFISFVRDFINFSFWPAFNLADSAITIGGIGLIIYFWKK